MPSPKHRLSQTAQPGAPTKVCKSVCFLPTQEHKRAYYQSSASPKHWARLSNHIKRETAERANNAQQEKGIPGVPRGVRT